MFSVVLLGDSNKLTKDDVRMFWMQNQVMLGWFIPETHFRVFLTQMCNFDRNVFQP